MMKYIIAIALFLVMLSPVSAAPGAGLVYGVESAIVNTNQVACVDYGIYNPFDVDSQITLTAEGELAELIDSSDSKFIPSGTSKDDAVAAQICFAAPDLRTRTCTIPFILCDYSCEYLEEIYEGQVLASPELPSELGGSGSSVGMAIAAPFTLLVRCEGEGYDYLPLILLIAGIAVLVMTIILLRKKHHKHESDKTQRRFDQWQNYQQQPPTQPPAQSPVQQPQQYYQTPQQPPQQYTQPQQPEQSQQQYSQPTSPDPQYVQPEQPKSQYWQPPQE